MTVSPTAARRRTAQGNSTRSESSCSDAWRSFPCSPSPYVRRPNLPRRPHAQPPHAARSSASHRQWYGCAPRPARRGPAVGADAVWWFATRYILMALGVEAETLELAVFYIRVLVLYLWPQLMQRAMISIL